MKSSSVTSAVLNLSSAQRARAAVFAPVLIASFSLCSLAHAQGAPAPSVPVAAPAAAPAAPPAAAAVAQPAPERDERLPYFAPRVHEGFYLRLGSGPSVLSLRGHGPYGSASITDSGASGFIAIGGAIVPGLVLAGTLEGMTFGAEFKGGPFAHATVSSNGETRSASHNAEGGFGMIGLLVDWYPQPKAGWHAGLASGLGAVGLTNSADDSGLGGVNFAGSLFGGYDWALARNWSLGLQLTASGGTSTKMRDDSGSHDTGYRLTPLSVGVQASVLYF